MMIMNGEMGNMGEEATVAYFELFSQNYPREFRKLHKDCPLL
jgi:hypothetical protein